MSKFYKNSSAAVCCSRSQHFYRNIGHNLAKEHGWLDLGFQNIFGPCSHCAFDNWQLALVLGRWQNLGGFGENQWWHHHESDFVHCRDHVLGDTRAGDHWSEISWSRHELTDEGWNLQMVDPSMESYKMWSFYLIWGSSMVGMMIKLHIIG